MSVIVFNMHILLEKSYKVFKKFIAVIKSIWISIYTDGNLPL